VTEALLVRRPFAEAVEYARASKHRIWRSSWPLSCVEVLADGTFRLYFGAGFKPWTPTDDDVSADDWVTFLEEPTA
jgi:hypothetical protein